MTGAGSLVVLVVDDNAVNRYAMTALLERLDVPCVVVSSGREALAKLRRDPYALVLMDLMMPDMDGFQASREIRELEFGTGRHTPIVAVTALDDVRAACLAAGIDDIITKPVLPDTMAAKVRLWTRKAVVSSVADLVDSEREVLPLGHELRLLYGVENIQNILNTFLKVTQTLLRELDAAISVANVPAIRRAVHELKGCTLQVRAREMAELCVQLEAASQQNDHHQMVTLYAALAHAFLRVKTVLARSTGDPAIES